MYVYSMIPSSSIVGWNVQVDVVVIMTVLVVMAMVMHTTMCICMGMYGI